jgi:hypothetical protein
MELKPELDAKGIRLIAVAGEHLGHDEFVPEHWKSDMFFDIDKKSMWPILGSGTGSGAVGGIASYATGGVVAKNMKRTKDKGITGNLKGEGLKLGGVWVLGAGTQGLLFEHQEAR